MKRLNRYFMVLFVFLVLTSCIDTGNKRKNEKTSLNAATVQKKPNIIYILADDLGYGDLGCYGQTKFKTPNIDKLASQGMMFTQHYSGSTVCAPSRSALLTGMHTGHTAVRGNKEIQPEGQYPIPDNTYTLAEAMKKAGYVTGAFGKWGLGFPGSEGDPVNQGFDVFYGYNCQRLGHHYYPRHLWSNKDSVVLAQNSGKKKEVYAPALIHEKTLEFIEQYKEEPFFLYVPSIIPHAELAAPEVFMKKNRGKYLPEKAYKGLDDGPEYRKGPYESQTETHAAFVSMIEVLDEQVGEIMQKLEELGLDDNTMVVFTSDNGPHREGGADPEYFNSNGPFKGTKRDLYEGGIRVPMIVKWPGKVEPGSFTDHLSAFWDVFPTFSEIIGVEVPDNIDGISFLPELLGHKDEQAKHQYLYWEFHEKGGRQAVRMGDWKAVKYNVLQQPDAPLELYNLADDIGEEHNIAGQHPEIVEQMGGILDTVRTPSQVFTFSQSTYLNSK
ncbi:arylsulfatase [Sinomicrobium weinanense]|uniref:Arylsulfatase n=1 Tax=Sinomicrobium weinanense TaxID=2842200 RepID=A0A926Q4K2_9FLAO|nr:arylsulfatase [Sinomicrobium weinanense]MBC9797171.1 arylsulfatase [Sinomicrobium weinanense]MBU3125853.1 arylsulfatase [Sinomicrobium weinanense]